MHTICHPEIIKGLAINAVLCACMYFRNVYFVVVTWLHFFNRTLVTTMVIQQWASFLMGTWITAKDWCAAEGQLVEVLCIVILETTHLIFWILRCKHISCLFNSTFWSKLNCQVMRYTHTHTHVHIYIHINLKSELLQVCSGHNTCIIY